MSNQDVINKVGFCAQLCVSWWHVRNRRFQSGPYVMASLTCVPHGRGWLEFQMFVDIIFR
jgi:hypothetical protein